MSIRKRGDRYQVRIRVGSGQRLERTLPAGATLADARALEIALGRARIDAAVGRRPKYLIDQAIDRWVETSAKSLRSWKKDLRYRVETIRTHTAGRPLDAITDVADAIKTAGVRNFRFHDLRHSCASYLAQRDVPLLKIAHVLGHRQLSITQRYSHLSTQDKADVIRRVLGDIK